MDEIKIQTESVELVAYGNTFLVISDQETLNAANEYLTQNKAKQKMFDEYFDPEIELANKAHKNWLAKKKAAVGMLAENYKKVSEVAGAYLSEQERIKKAERELAEAEAARKAAEAQAIIIAAAEKEQDNGNEQGAADLMEQATDIVPVEVETKKVVSNFKGTSGSTSWGTDLSVTVKDPAAIYKAALAGEFPIGCVEISVKVSVLKAYFKGNKITEYNKNGVEIKEIKIPRTVTP